MIRFSLATMAVLCLTAAAGCGDEDEADTEATPKVEGTFVGKVSKTDAFVGIVVSPSREGAERQAVDVFVCDGEKLCEWFEAAATENAFAADSEDRDAKAEGELSAGRVKGTIKLDDEEAISYSAEPAAAAAGVYDLTVSNDGDFRGASAAGVALEGESTLPKPGPGTLKLADGERLELEISANPGGDPVGLRAGQVRLIVLSDGVLRGAGSNRQTPDGEASDFFVRSAEG